MKDEYGHPICAQCNSSFNVIQASGARLDNHSDYPIFLCWECKSWLNEEGEFLNTI